MARTCFSVSKVVGMLCLCFAMGCAKDDGATEPPVAGSKDWRSVYSAGPKSVTSFVFATPKVGFLNLQGDFISPAQGSWAGSFRTDNGADSWSSFYTNTGYSSGEQVLPQSSDTAFSWISQGGPQAITSFKVTTNGGQQWNAFSNHIGAWVYDVARTEAQKLIALTGYGSVMEVTANGVSELTQLNIVYNYHTFFKFSNSKRGHLFTPDSTGNYIAYLTNDGGQSWNLQYQFSEIVNDAAFTSPKEGFVCGTDGLLLKTIDGGQNWIPMIVQTTEHLNALCFTEDGRIYCVGDNGVFLTLEPGEVEWKQDIDFPIQESINEVQMFDSAHGYLSTLNDLYKKG